MSNENIEYYAVERLFIYRLQFLSSKYKMSRKSYKKVMKINSNAFLCFYFVILEMLLKDISNKELL